MEAIVGIATDVKFISKVVKYVSQDRILSCLTCSDGSGRANSLLLRYISENLKLKSLDHLRRVKKINISDSEGTHSEIVSHGLDLICVSLLLYSKFKCG